MEGINQVFNYKDAQAESIAKARATLQAMLGVHRCPVGQVREEVESIYGPLTEDTWYRWCKKVDASADAPLGPGFLSSISRHLLRCNAIALSGNKPGQAKKQIRRSALAYLALKMSDVSVDEWIESFAHLPEKMSPREIEDRISSQSLRNYSLRHYRRNGIYRSKPTYHKPEIVEILKRFNCA